MIEFILMALEYITPKGFNPYRMEDFFGNRGWQTELIKASNTELVKADAGAALECGDGRSDEYPTKKLHGPRVFGQMNGVAALVTGGDLIGFVKAAEYVIDKGYAPGTHGDEHGGEGCGAFGLWKNGKYSDVHSFRLPYGFLETQGMSPTEWVKMTMKMLGGKHFTLPGSHQEQSLRINSGIGLTERSISGTRFKVDDWFLEEVPFNRRLLYVAETVEQLKPDAKKIEIIIP